MIWVYNRVLLSNNLGKKLFLLKIINSYKIKKIVINDRTLLFFKYKQNNFVLKDEF